jgi:predicted acetyltransferase
MQVRTIQDDELEAWTAAFLIPAFLDRSAAEDAAFLRPRIDLSRTWAAFDGEQIVGTLRSWATELTTPGGVLPADGVTNVGVSPTHRRQGVMTRVVEAALARARERQEPVSILIASEYPIYARFGYGPCTYHASYVIDVPRVRFLRPAPGNVEQVDRQALRDVGFGIYESFRKQQPGAIFWPQHRWESDFGTVSAFGRTPWRGFCALYREPDGRASGYVRYHVDSSWEQRMPRGTVVVDQLVSTTPAAYAALWRFCCELDLVTTVSAADRPIDEHLPWLLSDARAVRQQWRSDFLWLRILDVPRTLSARRYAQDASAVLEVIDPQGYAAGRFKLETSGEHATCRSTTESADVSLGVDTLGATFLGGTTLRALYEAGLVDEHRPDAVERLSALLRTSVTPWCNTWF